MLQTVTIQNFKSLKDVTVKLQKVNLLIGPNNSGKSNFLKDLTFLKEHIDGNLSSQGQGLNRFAFGQELYRYEPIAIGLSWDFPEENIGKFFYRLEILGLEEKIFTYREGIGCSKNPIDPKLNLKEIDFVIKKFYEADIFFSNLSYLKIKAIDQWLSKANELPSRNYNLSINIKTGSISKGDHNFNIGGFLDAKDTYFIPRLSEVLRTLKIYKPDPSRITKENLLLFDKHVNEDCSNLVAFLDNMRDEHPDVYGGIEKDLNRCLPAFKGIRFEKVKINNKEGQIGKRFGLIDTAKRTYWAEELSEGTIYFLALLAIIHQPNPPKVLLLEEPEKGIHPRRIAEVMDLIFRLAEEKDIQIILTSHSTQVVDAFQDIPESVFVFDIENGETKIKNLLTDIIEPDNKNAKDKDYPKLDFSKHSLGEHWAIGFLGGVPAK